VERNLPLSRLRITDFVLKSAMLQSRRFTICSKFQTLSEIPLKRWRHAQGLLDARHGRARTRAGLVGAIRAKRGLSSLQVLISTWCRGDFVSPPPSDQRDKATGSKDPCRNVSTGKWTMSLMSLCVALSQPRRRALRRASQDPGASSPTLAQRFFYSKATSACQTTRTPGSVPGEPRSAWLSTDVPVLAATLGFQLPNGGRYGDPAKRSRR
jgi:hypothetical protein